MTTILEAKDKNCKRIRLTKERWSHISREHPEVASVLLDFEETLINPTKFVDCLYDASIKYFYKHYKNRPSEFKYLLLIVKYLNGDGFIITAYFVRNVK